MCLKVFFFYFCATPVVANGGPFLYRSSHARSDGQTIERLAWRVLRRTTTVALSSWASTSRPLRRSRPTLRMCAAAAATTAAAATASARRACLCRRIPMATPRPAIALARAQVLSELTSDAQLEHFRLEYETLYRALKKSHESEKRLVKKCRELSNDISSTTTKAAAAVKLSAEDQSTIAQLKNDILRTSTAVESSLIKEKDTKEELAALKEEIEQLKAEVKAGTGSSAAQENKLRDLIAQRDDLARERDSTAHHVMQLRGDITDLSERLKSVEAEKVKVDAEVAELRREIEARRNETERERKRKEHFENRLKVVPGFERTRPAWALSCSSMLTSPGPHVALMLTSAGPDATLVWQELKALLEQRQGELKQKQSQVSKGAEHAGRLEVGEG